MLPPEIPPALAQTLDERGYATLTPVQLAVLQPGQHDRDLLVSARTGSGKTVAYGLAIAPEMLAEGERLPPPAAPLALVIAPTRELAVQVQKELEWLYARTGARVVSCVGGMDPRREQRALAQGAHVVVGTPGRLRDHLERGQLSTAELRVVVLDEADEMLDLGFREELEEILDTTPDTRRTLLFSATLPKPIVALAKRYQQDALRIEVGAGEPAHADIEYRALLIAPNDVESATVNLLRYFEAGAALVFCSTREAVRRLHANLVERGFVVVALSGELTQTERTHALQALRDRRARVCVATDVAARGIDIPDLELVIHADLPNDAESLQHRSGRTGRAGRKGVSALLVPYPRRRRAEQLLRAAHVDARWVAPPTAEEIRERDQARLLEELIPVEETAEEDLAQARALLAQGSPEIVAAALVRVTRARLPAAEDLMHVQPPSAAPTVARARAEFRPEPPGTNPRPGFEDTVWFRINIGRNKNADPRWILPLICRHGHITKSEIGAIRISDRETRFEVTRPVVERFLEALQKMDSDGLRIEPLDEALPLPPRERRPPRKRDPEPAGEQRPETPPPQADRPARGRPNDRAHGPAKPRTGAPKPKRPVR